MNRKRMFGALAIMIVIASVGSVSAFGGHFFRMDPDGGNAVVDAIKEKDFNAWKNAISAQLTEENFNKLVQRQEAMSQRHENMSERRALSKEINQAIKDGNYEAWKTAVVNSKSPMVSKITNEDQFKILVQLYQAKQDGNYTKVKELTQQLGLPVPGGNNKIPGHFGRRRMN